MKEEEASTAPPPSGSEDDALTRRVIAVIAKTQDVSPEEIPADATFEELGFDSLDGFEIVFSLEEEFDVDIPDDDAREVTSVREAVRRLRPLVEGGGGA